MPPKMKEFSKKSQAKDLSVKSLSEYVKLLEKYSSKSYFFRGENSFFKERTAKAFHHYDEEVKNHSVWKAKYHDFMKAVDTFHSEIAYRLKEYERSHFLAFSQHYGVPTNLIDVSSSPLTALYFACYRKSTDKSTDGYVYVFDDKYIDIGLIISKSLKKDFIELMLKKDLSTILAFVKEMQQFQSRYPQQFEELFDDLISDMKCYLGKTLGRGDPVKKLKRYKKKRHNDFGWETNNSFAAHSLNEKHEYVDIKLGNITDVSSPVFVYTILIIHLISQLHEFKVYVYWFNGLPQMVYRPDILFERARIQRGFFIAQAFMHYTDPDYKVNTLARQRIHFEQRIKVEDPARVLKELDNIGVNRASIYGDLDNIAAHIVDRYKPTTDAGQSENPQLPSDAKNNPV